MLMPSSVGAKKLWSEGKLPQLQYCIYYIKKNFIHIDCGRQRKNSFEMWS